MDFIMVQDKKVLYNFSTVSTQGSPIDGSLHLLLKIDRLNIWKLARLSRVHSYSTCWVMCATAKVSEFVLRSTFLVALDDVGHVKMGTVAMMMSSVAFR